MLEENYRGKLERLLIEAECKLELPPDVASRWRHGDAIPPVANDRRRDPRVYHVVKAVLQVEQSLPEIARSSGCHRVLTKDYSKRGISFLHSEELFPGETIVLWLPVGKVRCHVVRCRRHQRCCYEIGATFKREDPLQ